MTGPIYIHLEIILELWVTKIFLTQNIRAYQKKIIYQFGNRQMEKIQKGFTFFELMIITAIIGLLAVVALPVYQNYTERMAFSELVLAVIPRKSAIELIIESRNPVNLSVIDGGLLGVPANIAVADGIHGASVTDGVITMTWKLDATSNLSAITYTLTPDGVTPPVQWTEGGTCLTSGFC